MPSRFGDDLAPLNAATALIFQLRCGTQMRSIAIFLICEHLEITRIAGSEGTP